MEGIGWDKFDPSDIAVSVETHCLVDSTGSSMTGCIPIRHDECYLAEQSRTSSQLTLFSYLLHRTRTCAPGAFTSDALLRTV